MDIFAGARNEDPLMTMHNITKIKLFRIVLRITYLPSLIFLYPIVIFKKKQKGNLFFFFDRYSLGGAQRVHLDILKSVESTEKLVFFTRKSSDDTFKREFENIKCTSLHFVEKYCEPFLIRIFSVHYFVFYINRHPNARVLSSNSTFFYDMLPFIRKEVVTIELLHNFSFGKNGMEFFGLMNSANLTWRLTIDEATRGNIINQYREYRVPDLFDKRIKTIEFGVDIPDQIPEKSIPPLKVFYAGRGGPQKRIPLMNSIALHFIRLNKQVRFYFAGTIDNELTEEVKQNSICFGAVSDKIILNQIFSEGHVLIMTSAYEGFPVLVKEAMAHGCVPVVTALPGIMTHLTNGQNALLIKSVDDEAKVIEEGIQMISLLLEKKQVLEKISNTCYQYAREHFDKKYFYQAYAELLS
jgi:glycosyltransferase involved in cell wall biosynthesis